MHKNLPNLIKEYSTYRRDKYPEVQTTHIIYKQFTPSLRLGETLYQLRVLWKTAQSQMITARNKTQKCCVVLDHVESTYLE